MCVCTSVCSYLYLEQRWLDCAKTNSEITDGPNRATSAVSQLWGYHYFVAGCQGTAWLLRSVSSDASHMCYDYEA